MGDSNGNGCISQKQRLQVRGVESIVIAVVVGLVVLVGNQVATDLLAQWRDGPVHERRLADVEGELDHLRTDLAGVRSEMSQLNDSINVLTTKVVELNTRLQFSQESHVPSFWSPHSETDQGP